MNNKNILNKNTENFTPTKLDWSIIQAEMRNKLGNDIYESWLKKISFVEELKNYVLLSVSTRFIRDWITSRYLDQILQIIKIYKKDINRIELKINEKKDENINQISQREISLLNENGNVAFIKNTYLQYNTIDSNKKFENFIIGSSNKLAFEASKKITENISGYNPLYIYGGVGMGKTHLLNAIGLSLKEKNKVMFVSAERFMYQFVKSIKSNEMVKFKEYFRNTDILLIDDIQFMNGKEAMQEEFFHTFNALLDKGSQVILSADRAPNKLSRIQERIKSRFAGGLVMDIQKPDYDLRHKIVKTKIDELNVFMSEKSLADKIKSNTNFLDGKKNFSRIKYEKFLLENNITAPHFEIKLKNQELKRKLFNYISGGIKSPYFLKNKLFINEQKKVVIDYYDLNLIYNKDASISEIDEFIKENEELLKEDHIDFSYAKITPRNLVEIDDFNKEFFKKIDEIENNILNGFGINEIKKSFSLKVNSYTNFKINDESDEILKTIYSNRNGDKIQLVDKNEYFLLFEIFNLNKIFPNKSDPKFIDMVKNGVILKKRYELNQELYKKIEEKKLNDEEFIKIAKNTNNIQSVTIENINDNSLFIFILLIIQLIQLVELLLQLL